MGDTAALEKGNGHWLNFFSQGDHRERLQDSVTFIYLTYLGLISKQLENGRINMRNDFTLLDNILGEK